AQSFLFYTRHEVRLQLSVTYQQELDVMTAAILQHPGRIEYRVQPVRNPVRTCEDREQVFAADAIRAPWRRVGAEQLDIAAVGNGGNCRGRNPAPRYSRGYAGRKGAAGMGTGVARQATQR